MQQVELGPEHLAVLALHPPHLLVAAGLHLHLQLPMGQQLP